MTNFHKLIGNHHTSILINHHNISLQPIALKFNLDIIETKTVDILIAKQIIAGEKIIGIRFFSTRYFNGQSFPIFSSKPKTLNKIIIGDKAIAIHNIHILIINNTETAINGIHIAITCHNDIATANNEEKVQLFDGTIQFHIFNNEEYNAVKIQTYECHDIISCNLLEFQSSHVHLL